MSHIAHYGTWLKGDGSWRSDVVISPRATLNKERRIAALAKGFTFAAPRLHPTFHQKYKTTIRRELQRLDLLRQGIPIPPTRILDFEWEQDSTRKERLLCLAANLIKPAEYQLIHRLLSNSCNNLFA